MEDFRDSLLIFDDPDVIPDKVLKAAVYSLLDQALQTGRHFNTSVIISQHLPNSKHLRVALTEMFWFCYFPWGSTGSTRYVLENYCGVDTKNLAKIKATKSRWACVFKNFPQCVLTEKNIFLLSNEVWLTRNWGHINICAIYKGNIHVPKKSLYGRILPQKPHTPVRRLW